MKPQSEKLSEKNIRLKDLMSVTLKGLAINLLLSVIKTLSGIFGRSSAMIADGIHSLSDSVSDIFLILGLRFADKPPDSNHRYGHGKIETLITVIISLMILFAGFVILGNNAYHIYLFFIHGVNLRQPGIIALFAAFISIVIKEILYRISKNAGIKHNSNAMTANAWHHRTDAFTSVAALLGISGAMLLGSNWFILDPLAAVLVSIFIIFVGLRLIKESIKELLETSLGEKKEREIIKIIRSVDGVLNPHNLKTRRVGNSIVIDVHIEVNKFLNIIQAHDIATEVETNLLSKFGSNTYVSVHVEPFDKLT